MGFGFKGNGRSKDRRNILKIAVLVEWFNANATIYYVNEKPDGSVEIGCFGKVSVPKRLKRVVKIVHIQ